MSHKYAEHKAENSVLPPCLVLMPCSALPTPRKNLTEAQTADLIRVTALPPAQRRQAYRAVLQKIMSGWTLFKQWGVDFSKAFLEVRRQAVVCMTCTAHG